MKNLDTTFAYMDVECMKSELCCDFTDQVRHLMN